MHEQPTSSRPSLARSSPAREGAALSLSESENTIRGLKSSLSVVAAFQAEGFPSPPSGIASMVADFVRSATQGIPLEQLAGMAPGTGQLANAASAAVNLVVGGLTQDQKEVMKAGGNPFDAAAVARFAEMLAKLGSHAVGVAMMNGGSERGEKVASLGSSGAARYGAVRETESANTSGIIAKAANTMGVPWAGGHPDIIGLGGTASMAAVKAFGDVKLREDSYNRFTKEAGFSTKDAVAMAKFAKEKGLDANQLFGDAADVVKGLAGNDKKKADELRKAIKGYIDRPNDPAAKEAYDKVLKQYESDPSKKPFLDRARQLDKKREEAVKSKRDNLTASNDAALADLNGPKPPAQKSNTPATPAAPKP